MGEWRRTEDTENKVNNEGEPSRNNNRRKEMRVAAGSASPGNTQKTECRERKKEKRQNSEKYLKNLWRNLRVHDRKNHNSRPTDRQMLSL